MAGSDLNQVVAQIIVAWVQFGAGDKNPTGVAHAYETIYESVRKKATGH